MSSVYTLDNRRLENFLERHKAYYAYSGEIEIDRFLREVLQKANEFVPSAADAIEVVKGRVVLVDGTLTPCWSYEEHQELWNKKHETTGFNVQLISLLDGTAAWISGPLPGKYCARHSMLKMRFGAEPLVDVKIPDGALTRYRSSQYG